jgi:S-adenosylmethionine hydrolase
VAEARRGSVVLVSDCTDIAFVEMMLAAQRRAEEHRSGAADRIRFAPLVACNAYSALHASFLLRLIAESALPSTVLMHVMNSGRVRGERLFGRLERAPLYFEGANTGAFGWLAQAFGCSECVELPDPGFVAFGGKRIHAPAVGRFCAGAELHELGSPFDVARIRGGPPPDNALCHIDNFGNGKIFAEPPADWEDGLPLRVTIDGRVRLRAMYWERMMEREAGTWVVYPGSSLNLLELGQVRGNGLLDHDVSVGASVEIDVADAE